MQNTIISIFTISLIFLLSACVSEPASLKRAQSKLPEISLISAGKLEKRQQHLEALKQYNILINNAVNRHDLYAAMRGKARCLRAIGRLKLAISALSPLSINPKTPLDCLQLAMAGELLLQMRKYKESESALEVALDGVRNKEKKYSLWTAAASANLGNAYLHNGKLTQAQTMYKKAAKLFHFMKKPEFEKKCFRTTLALEQIQLKGENKYAGKIR